MTTGRFSKDCDTIGNKGRWILTFWDSFETECDLTIYANTVTLTDEYGVFIADGTRIELNSYILNLTKTD